MEKRTGVDHQRLLVHNHAEPSNAKVVVLTDDILDNAVFVSHRMTMSSNTNVFFSGVQSE